MVLQTQIILQIFHLQTILFHTNIKRIHGSKQFGIQFNRDIFFFIGLFQCLSHGFQRALFLVVLRNNNNVFTIHQLQNAQQGFVCIISSILFQTLDPFVERKRLVPRTTWFFIAHTFQRFGNGFWRLESAKSNKGAINSFLCEIRSHRRIYIFIIFSAKQVTCFAKNINVFHYVFQIIDKLVIYLYFGLFFDKIGKCIVCQVIATSVFHKGFLCCVLQQ